MLSVEELDAIHTRAIRSRLDARVAGPRGRRFGNEGASTPHLAGITAVRDAVIEGLAKEAARDTCNDCVMNYDTGRMHHTLGEWIRSHIPEPPAGP